MRSLPVTLVAAMACTVGAERSSAADLPVTEEQAVEFVQLTWAGFYIGSQIGVIAEDNDRSFPLGPFAQAPVTPFGGIGGATGAVAGEIEGPELFGGLHAGYNWQAGSLVFGLEADASSIGRVDDVLATFRGRLGLGADRFLVYGTAGLAYASVEGGLDGVFVGGNGGNGGAAGPGGNGGNGGSGFGAFALTSADADSVGFVGGVGAEFLLSPSVGIGAQALYHSFDFDDGVSALDDDFLTVSGRLTVHLHNSAVAQLGVPDLSGAASPWSGFYLGGHLGTLHRTADDVIDEVELSNGQNGGPGVRGIDGGGGGGGAIAFASLARDAGLTGGGHFGYNWQANSLVFGAEADIDASTEDSNDIYGSLRGRLGWTNQEVLFYGTAGVAVVNDQSTLGIFAENGGNGGNGGAVIAAPGGAGGAGGRALGLGQDDETRIGFVGGAGVEGRISDRITAGLEALYYDFEDRDDAPAIPGAGRFFLGGDDTSDALVVRTRFSFALHR